MNYIFEAETNINLDINTLHASNFQYGVEIYEGSKIPRLLNSFDQSCTFIKGFHWGSGELSNFMRVVIKLV